jgi:tetratricopeptide (TPR) repeat protein
MGGADGLTRLEKSRASRPNDAAVARSLGIAYYKAERYTNARTHLDQAVRLDPRDGAAALYLGLTAEQQKDMPGAKAAYQAYLRYGKTSKVRKQLEARLAAITRRELQLAAKSAVAQERQLAARPGSVTTVAVMPLRFVGPDSSLIPLERGMAELITTDLSRTDQIIVVERARLAALLAEMSLQKSGATDRSTNVRAGKIIQAGRIVSGQLLQSGERLRVDAAIVNTATSLVAGGATSENTIEQVFAIEKAIVLQLFDSLGVKLTLAQRKDLDDRPVPRSLPAFLAYSRGLTLEDAGRYDDAARSYQDAFRLDPSFTQAKVKGADAQAAAQGTQMSAASIEIAIVGTTEASVAQQSVQGQAPGSGGSGNGAGTMADQVNPSAAGGATSAAGGGSTGSGSGSTPTKDPAGAATSAESTAKTATVLIVVKLPKP